MSELQDSGLTVGQAAERLGISVDTLRRWTREGRLKAGRHPINNYRIYEPSEVDALRRYIQREIQVHKSPNRRERL